MKKNIIVFTIIFFITIGFAAVNTVLDIKENINISENLNDFKIEITNLIINNVDKKDLISKDKESFTFVGSGSDSIKYTVTNYSYQYDAKVNLICNPSDDVTVNQIDNLEAQSKKSETITSTSTNEITCTLSVEKVSRTEYAEDMCAYKEGNIWTFEYTGAEQEFTVPCDGEYKIELWGARGGDWYKDANGAYTKGTLKLGQQKKLYFYVGKMGDGSVGYGGLVFNYGHQNYLRNGGGATDIRIVNGSWNDKKSLSSRIMVAAGGGSSGGLNQNDGGSPYGGSAGGLIGYQGGTCITLNTTPYPGAKGATQTSGHAFGQVLQTYSGGTTEYNATGGNGYWSGNYHNWSAKPHNGISGTGGGSSFISGHNGCVAITSEDNITPRKNENGLTCTDGTTDITCSYHYSNMIFKNTVMIDGEGYNWTTTKGSYTGMPSHDGKSTMTGNSGNGFAKITYLGKK